MTRSPIELSWTAKNETHYSTGSHRRPNPAKAETHLRSESDKCQKELAYIFHRFGVFSEPRETKSLSKTVLTAVWLINKKI